MTPEEREQMNRLCTQIQDEKDHERFMQLIKELNDLIDRKEHRFEPPGETEVQLIVLAFGAPPMHWRTGGSTVECRTNLF